VKIDDLLRRLAEMLVGDDRMRARLDDYMTRTARYVAAITIASPEGEVRSTVATCEGVITEAPRGTNGFGYDPLFLVPELGRTMAELSPEEKNRISHRGRALRQARELLLAMLPDAAPEQA